MGDIGGLNTLLKGQGAAKDGLYRIIRNMRHELRTPLGQIIGYAELLLEDLEDDGLNKYNPDLQRIVSAARSLLVSVDTIFDLDSTAPSRGHPTVKLNKEHTDPGTSDSIPAVAAEESIGSLLVVDDVRENRDMLSRRMARQGYEVDTAEDGQAALKQVASGSYDLILLDVLMPGLSGLEVLERIRKEHSRWELPVIMFTAMDGSSDIVRALDMGANDYVTKPVDLKVVLARIETQIILKDRMDEVTKLAQQLELRNVFIRKTFGRYTSDEIVSEVLATPESLYLGGEKRVVTVLISDLRGFSTLSERLDPEQVVSLLNNFLSTMTDVINRHQGTIDEFLGDAILTLFGAPVARDNDPLRAVRCAVEMQLAMDQVNQWNREHSLPEVAMGIGIHTGEVVVGNIGSRKRTKYGVVGTTVNLASRFESLTLGGQILISQTTRDEVADVVRCRGEITTNPKGASEPMVVHDVEGIEDLTLPSANTAYQRLADPMPFSYELLEGKHCKTGRLDGKWLALSPEGAVVELAAPLPLRSEVRIHLGSDKDAIIYAKIFKKVDDLSMEHCVGFTSISPQAEKHISDMLP